MKHGKVPFAAVLALTLALGLAGCQVAPVSDAVSALEPTATASQTATATQSAASEVPQSTQTATTTPTSTPTATPTATPQPTPTVKVLEEYHSTIPTGLTVNLQYSKYAMPLDYFVSLATGYVRAQPDTSAKKLATFSFSQRHEATARVLGADGKTEWIAVKWSDKAGEHSGYVRAATGSVRHFRLDQALTRAENLKEQADGAGTVHVVNYKNVNGLPPALPNGKTSDSFGNRQNQAAPAYADAASWSVVRYAPDGLVGQVWAHQNGRAQVYFPSFGKAYWVPEGYLNSDSIGTLTQTFVVDRANQNIAVLEWHNGWQLVGLSVVSTGKQGGYSLPTPLGDFVTQGKSTRFYYYQDGTTNIDGYAPWALRFSGGGYLHGVPRRIHMDANGNWNDPGPAESLSTLGTTPQSHMCVRNFTSFAKFMYDRFVPNGSAVIVFE